jgi:nucleotide-binding universal stress UspA family protein
MYQKILVPLDGSPTAARGFEEAVALARVTGARLRLLHVVDTYPVALEMATAATWQQVVEGMKAAGQTILDQARRTAESHGLTAEVQLIEAQTARVADVVVEDARTTGCDLIVMGTHGRRGFAHVVLGSDAERVVRDSEGPVLLVRHPEARKR